MYLKNSIYLNEEDFSLLNDRMLTFFQWLGYSSSKWSDFEVLIQWSKHFNIWHAIQIFGISVNVYSPYFIYSFIEYRVG